MRTVLQFGLMSFCLFYLIETSVFDWAFFEFFGSENCTSRGPLSPVIFIPGLGGSKLQAKLNKTTGPMRCARESDYFDIWVNVLQLIFSIPCWVDNMKLVYDNVTHKAKNTPGVELRFPDWRDADAVKWVTRNEKGFFDDIANALAKCGYSEGKNVFAAPYDFRKGPKNTDWFDRMQQLTEYAYENNNHVRITYIAHSMGGRMLLYFLQQMPQTWKDKYVKRFIAMSVPWGGSIQSIMAMSIGYNPFPPFLFPANDHMKTIQETFSSLAWLLPSDDFWAPTEVLAVISGKNYTLENIDEFFYDIGLPNVVEMRKDQSVYSNAAEPGVEMHCLFGSNADSTVERLEFSNSFDQNPATFFGNGDEYVNQRSLAGCNRWFSHKMDAQKNKIYQKEFSGLDHVTILDNSAPINYIVETLTNVNDESKTLENNIQN
ncbi:phospholipase A2 group XV-like isoform X2 [Sitodiplosis mosellana]|uniref:phospholipase A2 group XV-like isoform X2 n=1 Tax=Sitodiplosis mosellana TaxID=263140 RepID=UPI0024440DC2|nr:phospholipase A2 group XV-like isoform X2 [Sitodiplosis mosellana]